ncbi:MAG: hypothetical protein HC859_13000, partial [Bacteroidia bacterium]|nr:hypothetical protein [Bacteroidia bacterium]
MSAQYDNEKDATIPLENFYIKRRGSGVLRLLLSKVHIGFSTGYGSTRFVHKLDGFGILQKPDSLPKIFLNNQVSSSYSNWFNNVQAAPTTVTPGTFLVQSDTAELGFRSKAFNIPLKATLHVELYDRYRIGGGFSIDYMNIGTFAPTAYGDNISGFAPEKSTVWLKKYFLMLGGTVYRYYEYSLVVDANIGAYSLGGGF